MEVVADGLGGYNLQVTATIEDYDTTLPYYEAASSAAVVFEFYLVLLDQATVIATGQEVASLSFNKAG